MAAAAAAAAADVAAAMLTEPTRLADWLVVLPIAVPLTGAALLLTLRERELMQGRVAALFLAVSSVIAVALLLRVVATGPVVMTMGNWLPPFGISVAIDPVGALLVATTAVVGFLGAIYSLFDINAVRRRFGYYSFYLLLIAGVSGAFSTGDIFNLYVWFEVFLISSFGLLVLGGERIQLDGAVKYGVLNLLGTTFFLIATAYLYGLTGTLNMADLKGAVAGLAAEAPIMAVTALFVLAFSMKAAAFPLHFWLPASYHTPRIVVGAIFAGLLTKVGVYSLLRIVVMLLPASAHGFDTVILIVGILTALLGVAGALAQTDIRRLTGFLVISGIGVMLIGIGIGTEAALAGTIAYAVHSMVATTALFLTIGIAERLRTGAGLAGFGAIYRTQPFVAAMFFVFGFALAGLPPFSGFWPKVLLIQAALAETAYLATAVIVVTGFLTTLAIGRVWVLAYLREAGNDGPFEGAVTELDPASRPAWAAPLVIFAGLVLALGLIPEPLIAISQQGAAVLLDPDLYVRAVLGP
jgi:multicomponent Na+:H+ antiporter subunit D